MRLAPIVGHSPGGGDLLGTNEWFAEWIITFQFQQIVIGNAIPILGGVFIRVIAKLTYLESFYRIKNRQQL